MPSFSGYEDRCGHVTLEALHKAKNATSKMRARWPLDRQRLLVVQPSGAPTSWSWPMWLAWLVSRQSAGVHRRMTIAVIGANPECLTGAPVSPETCDDVMYRFMHARRPAARVMLVDADAGNLKQARRGYGELGPTITADSYQGALASTCGSWAHRAAAGFHQQGPEAARADLNSTPCCPRPPEEQRITFWRATRCTRKYSASHMTWLTGVGNLGDAGAAWTHTRGGAMEPVSVPCTTAGALLKERGFRWIDALHLDVEGAEFHVLASLLDEGVRPSVIMFELKILVEQHSGMLGVRLLNLLGLHGYVAFGLHAGPTARITQDFMAVQAATLLEAKGGG